MPESDAGDADGIYALVLAAGRGRRLGQPKALMDLGGRPALAHVLEVLAAAGLTHRGVVLGPDAEAVRAAVDLTGVELAGNPDPERGMSASLRAGLAGLRSGEALLLHTVDHPLVRAEDVRALCRAWREAPPGIAIVAPSVDGRRGHPTLFGPAAARELAGLADGEPPHQVVRSDPERVLHLTRADPWLVRDVDTPAELEAARAELRRRSTGAD